MMNITTTTTTRRWYCY